jgi:alpha-tubulin suppressor-like RCC1 family protein
MFNNSPIVEFSVNPARAADQVTCIALNAAGQVYGWGYNANGQLGNGSTNNVLQPTLINQNNIAKVFVLGEGSNGSQVFLLRNDGTAVSAGYNGYGQLAHNGNFVAAVTQFSEVRTAPTVVMDNIVDIVAGDSGFFNAIYFKRSNNTLWSGGYNGYGQLGNGTTTSTQAATNKFPTQVLTDVASVVAVNDTSSLGRAFAIKTDKSLWGTGRNANGQLGLGDTTQRNSFTQITTDVEKISVGHYSSAIIKTDGYIYTTGYNGFGQLGMGDVTQRTTFTQVPFNNTVEDIAFHANDTAEHFMAVDDEGRVFATGHNGQGQIGDGTVQQQHTLTQFLIPQ